MTQRSLLFDDEPPQPLPAQPQPAAAGPTADESRIPNMPGRWLIKRANGATAEVECWKNKAGHLVYDCAQWSGGGVIEWQCRLSGLTWLGPCP